MRTGAAISVAAHVAALTACLVLAGVRPFDPTVAEAITIDIVTPEEAPALPKQPETYDFPTLNEQSQEQTQPEASQPQAKSQQQATPEPMSAGAPAPSVPAKPKQEVRQAALNRQPAEQPKQPEPQTQPQQQPQEQPQPDVPTAAPDITSKFGMMFTLPDAGATGDFDAKATATANIELQDAAALRAHIKSCSVMPKSVSPADNVRIVLRVAFGKDGRLSREPLLIEASASEKGPALMRGAMEALERCQPYDMLPVERYDQWRMLDLSFSPKDFKGG